MSTGDLSHLSMLDLFRVEAENNTATLTQGLLTLERNPTSASELESCMRAAHSLKGAARIVNLGAAVRVAHKLEDCFVAAQTGQITLGRKRIDALLCGVDLLLRIARSPGADVSLWESELSGEVDGFLARLEGVLEDDAKEPEAQASAMGANVSQPTEAAMPPSAPAALEVLKSDLPDPVAHPGGASGDRVLRVTAENLNRLLGLAGESLVESRWLKPFAASLLRLKRMHHDLGKDLDALRDARLSADAPAQRPLEAVRDRAEAAEQFLSARLLELEMFERRSTGLAHRLYDEAIACRMRPFADGIQGFPRMVRDVARTLQKEVRFEVVGDITLVDRDILERLEAPLNHLLRNAIDHGIESPDQRRASGKPLEGTLRLEASHRGGLLHVSVSDDGCGIDSARMREAVLRRNLTNADTASKLSDPELLEFLFLPGFSMKGEVTELSGRGVGLDVVQTMVKQVRGSVRVTTEAGRGTRFDLQLPLTLSVVRALLVEIGGESYALPLAYIVRTLKVAKDQIERLETRQHIPFEGRRVGLVAAHQILERGAPRPTDGDLSVVVIGDPSHQYGLIVDGFLGRRELVVHLLDPRLGKIKDVSAGALLEDGSPVLILDMEDLIRSVEKLLAAGGLNPKEAAGAVVEAKKPKRVLVVDDSLTVRELERKLLTGRGYEVDVAVNGMDGWNAVRTGHFDLVVTDVDMPRMDGIELVKLIKKDPALRGLPVMIVSYKDREEDRRRGLDAGADYYLTKGSFHDETLLNAVVDLIGEVGP